MRELREAIYGGDPRSTAPGAIDPEEALDRSAFDGRRKIVQAVDGGTPVAQAVARISPDLEDADGRPVGTIGHFDSRLDSRAACTVLEAAVDWLVERGAGRIVGPMNGDVWHGYRFSVGPHDQAPCLMEPYNPSHYPVFWNDAGFEVCKTFHTKYGEDLEGAADQLERGLESAREAGYTLTSLAEADVEDPVAPVFRMLTAAFQAKEFVTPIAESTFRELYGGLEAILDPDLVWFARDPDGAPAGFVFGLPNYHEAVAAMNGAPAPVEKFAFLWNARPETAALHTIGVAPQHRETGLAYALAHKLYSTAASKGYRGIYGLLIEDGNPSSRLGAGFADVVRRYALFEYDLERGEHS